MIMLTMMMMRMRTKTICDVINKSGIKAVKVHGNDNVESAGYCTK